MFGNPAYPAPCNRSAPVDDYDSDGVQTDAKTHDLLMQDMWIHGHPGRGVKGPIGGGVTCLRCDISHKRGAGMGFCDGKAQPPVQSLLNVKYPPNLSDGVNPAHPMPPTV